MLVSSTAGTTPVYAIQESFGAWLKIEPDIFYALANGILNPDSDVLDKLGGLAPARTEHN